MAAPPGHDRGLFSRGVSRSEMEEYVRQQIAAAAAAAPIDYRAAYEQQQGKLLRQQDLIEQLQRRCDALRSQNDTLLDSAADAAADTADDAANAAAAAAVDTVRAAGKKTTEGTVASSASRVSNAEIDRFVKTLLADPSTNLQYVPDFVEGAVYRNILKAALHALARTSENASIELFRHRIRFTITPMDDEK